MKKLSVLLIVFVLLILAGGLWWIWGTSSVDRTDKTPKIFVVEEGQGVRQIANNLKKENLIRDPIAFFILTKRLGIDKEIEAGDFRLNPAMSAEEVGRELTHGTLDIWVTVPEGMRAGEIAEILKKRMPTYEDTWIQEFSANEGYLFPDTYLIPKDANAALVISLMRNTFDQKYKTLATSKTGLSQDEIVTIASLIEREARHNEDRPLVSSVIQNRLEIGMKLDIDATLQYALGYQEDEKRWWKKSLTNADKTIDSPYNTYANPGLPPTPISNPGLAALNAAVSPNKTDYFYYFTDKNGVNRYAETLEEHNANIRRYGL